MSSFSPVLKSRNFELSEISRTSRICFIGGGSLMLDCALHCRDYGSEVYVVVSHRHAREKVDQGGHLVDALKKNDIRFAVVDSVTMVRPPLSETTGWVAYCFGPQWIFPVEVRQRFKNGMLNFNVIPVPHFLGGAHYSWQVMSHSRETGFFVQEITSDLDKGDVVYQSKGKAPASVDTVRGLFQENHRMGLESFKAFFELHSSGEPLRAEPIAEILHDSLYFPRLTTSVNGFIDWAWWADDIVSFCRAFDDPYPGARTFFGEDLVVLRDVSPEKFTGGVTHPFMAGLIVRSSSDAIWVAAKGGLLVFRGAEFAGRIPSEGDRLHTPSDVLERARQFRPSTSDLM